MKRRDFLTGSVAAGLMLSNNAAIRADLSANDRITVAVIGVGGRGSGLLRAFAGQPQVVVKYICDVDERRMAKSAMAHQKQTGSKAEQIVDFRRALDDDDVDAIALGTATHWHAIPAIMACQAGKDVYVEKPDGHNALEGRVMVEAARKYKRVVTLGTQARSATFMLDLMELLRSGVIGRSLFAKGWESARQGFLSPQPDSEPPEGVHYDYWLGPAPKRPFNRARFHGNWRWFFDYGAGDLGNDGVHRLDLAKWAFDSALTGAGLPPLGELKAVSAHGAKGYFVGDMQQWPDNLIVTYDYGEGRLMTYEMRLWTPYPLEGEAEGAAIYGDKGYVIIGNDRWRVFGERGKLIREVKGDFGGETVLHVQDFLNCMRTRERPAADLETIGHSSSLLCHLGNAAWRAGRTLRFDPKTYTCIGDKEANVYLTRPEYRQPWVLPKMTHV
jgi:predicted dehydrogenase